MTTHIYVVHMQRYGDPELHSYIEGVYSDLLVAEEAAENERQWRDGKYEAAITAHVLDYQLRRTRNEQTPAEKAPN